MSGLSAHLDSLAEAVGLHPETLELLGDTGRSIASFSRALSTTKVEVGRTTTAAARLQAAEERAHPEEFAEFLEASDREWDGDKAYGYHVFEAESDELIGGCGLMRRRGPGAISTLRPPRTSSSPVAQMTGDR